MEWEVDVPLGSGRLRTLTVADADLVVEAMRAESGRALWGAHPVGPYAPAQARDVLGQWTSATRQVSYGVIESGRLVGAVGLMVDSDGGAELAYWVRPECRRQGIALRAVTALTELASECAGVTRLWLEINPDNVASQGLARKAGYRFTERLPAHCRSWVNDDPTLDRWHDCLIWTYR